MQGHLRGADVVKKRSQGDGETALQWSAKDAPAARLSNSGGIRGKERQRVALFSFMLKSSCF